ncbi:unnamed protein product [Trichobilharzia szidati]|nr:unnamed protein product [Trichobilharzia szidati]
MKSLLIIGSNRCLIIVNLLSSFATEQYFDSSGYFLSCIWSIPAILNSLIITVLLFLQVNTLLVRCKRLQMAHQQHVKKD